MIDGSTCATQVDYRCYVSQRALHWHHTKLDELIEELNQFKSDDLVSQKISIWVENLKKSLVSEETCKIIVQGYLQLLPEILSQSFADEKGELYFLPLDEETVLGNDGCSYGKKVLELHYHSPYYKSLPLDQKEMPPLEPHSELFFKTIPHLPVRKLFEFLKAIDFFLPATRIDQDYEELIHSEGYFSFSDYPPTLSTLERLQARRLRMQKDIHTFDQNCQKTEEKLSKESQNRFHAIGKDFKKSLKKGLKATKHEIEKRTEKVTNQIKASQAKMEELDRQNDELRGMLKANRETLNQAKAELIQAQIQMNETQRQIEEKRRSSSGNAFGMALLKIVGCCLVTLATQGLASPSCAGGLSASEGGFGVFGKFMF